MPLNIAAKMGKAHVDCRMGATARYGNQVIERCLIPTNALAADVATPPISFIDVGDGEGLSVAATQLNAAAVKSFSLIFMDSVGTEFCLPTDQPLLPRFAVKFGICGSASAHSFRLCLPFFLAMCRAPAESVLSELLSVIRPVMLLVLRVLVGHNNAAFPGTAGSYPTAPVRAA